MKRNEMIGIALFILCTAGIAVGVAIKEKTRGKTIQILARAPELGNFSPQRVVIPAGEKVQLLVRNVDTVSHGFTIPALGIDAGEVLAGNAAVIEVTPQKAGEYSFYCTIWCSEDHLQMKGVLEVVETPRTQTATN